jgi:hypothetical protein
MENKTYKEEIINLLLIPLESASIGNLNHVDFENQYRKDLKFQDNLVWKDYRACVDLIVDTEYAIQNTFEIQLGDLSTRDNNLGEMYIRLYGILNAVYLQIGAIKKLLNLVNHPRRDLLKASLNNLGIYKFRGMAGSHTVDYIYDEQFLTQNPELKRNSSFRLVQSSLNKTGSGIQLVDRNGHIFTFNLLDTLQEYEGNAWKIIIDIIKHVQKNLIKNKSHKNIISNQLNTKLLYLTDYSKMDKNKKWKENSTDNLIKGVFNF